MIDRAVLTGASPAREVHGNAGQDIQLAIDSLPDGGLVILGSERYTVSRTIVLHDGISVIGAGVHQTSIELLPNSGCHVFTNADHAHGNHDITIEGFSVEGNGEQQPRPVWQEAPSFCDVIYFKRVNNVRIVKMVARNIRQTAVHFSSCQNVRVEELIAEHLGWSGVSTNGTDGVVISKSFVRDAGRDVLHSGIHLDGGDGIRIVDVSSSSCTGNAVMLDSTFGPLRNCDLVHVDCADSRRGVSLVGSAAHELRGVAIRDSFCRNNREVGVFLSNANDVFICDTVVESNPETGILLQGRRGAHRCTIAGCTFIGNTTAIREIDASAENTFLDNRFVANGADVVRRVDWRTRKSSTVFVGASPDLSESRVARGVPRHS